MNANAMIQAFMVARKLGIFDRLKEGPQTAKELAESLDLAERPLELLLNQLAETGYIEKYGDDYALSVLGKMLPAELDDLGTRYWEGLEQWIRKGHRAESADTDFDKTDFAIEARAFEWMATPNAMDLVEILSIGRARKDLRVIELACGSAVFSSAMAYHDPGMKLWLVDSRENLSRARQTVESIGVTDRCCFIEADPVVYDATFDADLILIANRLCQYPDRELEKMLAHCRKNLNNKGELVIVDEFREHEEVLFAQRNLALLTEFRTPQGCHRDAQAVTDLLRKKGFVDIMYSDLKSPPGTRGALVAGVTEA